jgi:hypothetical protein
MSRRASVSSSSSSVHSSSDWDDSGSTPFFMSTYGIDSAYSVRLFFWFGTYVVFQLTRRHKFLPPIGAFFAISTTWLP